MVEKRVSKEQIKEQVKSIITFTESIGKVLLTMPDCGAKSSYLKTIEALEKKNNTFSKEKEILSSEEKEVMKKALNEFRQKKNEVSAPPDDNSTDEPIAEISEPITEQPSKRKGRKN